MASIRVLMFGWEFAPIVTGGLGVVCRDLSESLVKKDVKLTFVLPKFPKEVNINHLKLVNASYVEVEDAVLKQIQVPAFLSPYSNRDNYKENIRMARSIGMDVSDQGELYGMNLFEELEKYGKQAYQIAQDNQPDIIHAHDWMTFRAAENAKKLTGAPLIVHIHATEYDRSGGNPYKEIYEYEKAGMQAADKIIAVSERTKATIVSKYNIPEDRVLVVHNAVNHSPKGLKFPSLPEQKKSVLFLGRMSIQKGADYLLRAAQKVVQVIPDARFIFVGKGDMLKNLIELSIDLGIAENVVFTGFMSHEDVDRAYAQANLFVMPSISEPFGITALEAIRNGTPVLMSKQSGASEVVHNCLKVDFWDITEMANKIIAVLEHAPLAQTLSNEGYTDLERLTWDSQAEKVVKIYRDLLE